MRVKNSRHKLWLATLGSLALTTFYSSASFAQPGATINPETTLLETMQNDASLTDIVFVDRTTGWAVGDRGIIWHTNDGGNIWRAQPSGVTCRLAATASRTRSSAPDDE